jgi:hypothetical protein
MNHRVSINRLNKLADHLEHKVAPADFNMGNWHVDYECGFVACAWGHSCNIPSFRRAGLKLVASLNIKPTPYYCGHTGYEAAVEFLGITYAQAHYLFASEEYYPMKLWEVKPRHVVSRIRKLVRELERDYRRELKNARKKFVTV